jgi:hypothetical protein
MRTNNGNEANGARRGSRRRVRFDGVIVEDSAAMGRTFTIPADPRPLRIDLDADAPGWERLQIYLRRLARLASAAPSSGLPHALYAAPRASKVAPGSARLRAVALRAVAS